jgi:hypothetical protein
LTVRVSAIPDAKILTDATMNSGSAVLTSTAGLFVATDVGKLIYVAMAGGSGQPLKTTIASYQSATQVTLAATASANALVSGGPNINAVYGTDNSAAFNAALANAVAGVPATSNVRSRYASRKAVTVAAGSYLIGSALSAITVPNVTVSGAGPLSTFLYWCESGALFSLDTFTASPSTAYVGRAQGCAFENMTISGGPWTPPGSFQGSRVGTGIQDNGSGEVYLQNIRLAGLKYGFAGAYGSDYTRFSVGVDLNACDVGAYFGPGSQQLSFHGTHASQCREGLVFEGAPHFDFVAGSIEDCTQAAATIEAKASGTTRLGVPVTTTGAAYQGSWNFSGTWFETSADGTRLAPRVIYVSGDGPSSPLIGTLAVRDCYLVSGGTQSVGGTNCFVETNPTNPDLAGPIIDNLKLRGNYINYVVKYSGAGSTSSPQIFNTLIPAGSNINYSTGNDGGGVFDNGGSMSATRLLAPRFNGGTPWTLQMFPGVTTGTTPLFKIRTGASGTMVSGIVYGGAWVDRPIKSQTYAAALAIDASQCNHVTVTMTGNVTSTTVNNLTSGQELTIEYVQDGTGSRTYVWPTICKFAGGAAPTASTTAGWADAVTFIYDGTNLREKYRVIGVR